MGARVECRFGDAWAPGTVVAHQYAYVQFEGVRARAQVSPYQMQLDAKDPISGEYGAIRG